MVITMGFSPGHPGLLLPGAWAWRMVCGMWGSWPRPGCSVGCAEGTGLYPHHPSLSTSLSFSYSLKNAFFFFLIVREITYSFTDYCITNMHVVTHRCRLGSSICPFRAPLFRDKGYLHPHGDHFFVLYSFTSCVCIPKQYGLILFAFNLYRNEPGYPSLCHKHPKLQWLETRIILFFFLRCWVDLSVGWLLLRVLHAAMALGPLMKSLPPSLAVDATCWLHTYPVHVDTCSSRSWDDACSTF